MKYLLLFAALAVCGVLGAAQVDGNVENQLLEAFSQMQYNKVRQLAKNSPRPEFQLMSALCDVFDRRSQNLKRGIPKLEELSKSAALPERYRGMAKLAYARAMHTLALRKNVYPQSLKVNPIPLYDEVIEMYPETNDAVCAVIYRAQLLFEKGDNQKAFELTEQYIASCKDKDARRLCAIHLMLMNEYIRVNCDHKTAMKHALRARILVPATPKRVHLLHFSIARIYDQFLKDDVKAEKEYISFLEQHPDTSEAVLARRYLKELRARRAK